MDPVDAPLPRYDFYQSPTHLILSLYLKGYNAPGVVEQVDVSFEETRVVVTLPPLASPAAASSSTVPPSSAPQRVTLEPLYARIRPGESTSRILGSKIELKLAKTAPDSWPALLGAAEGDASTQPPVAAGNSHTKSPAAASEPPAEEPRPTEAAAPKKKEKKNWDKLVDEDENGKDADLGGDAALQKLFSSLYSNADPDTRRAMIKSYTESGGTTLSTDWSKIGKEKTKIQPPEGMEARTFH